MSIENGESVPELATDENPSSSNMSLIASQKAIRFLADIDDATWDSLIFSDTLVTISEAGKEIGEMNLSVEQVMWKDEPCYLVHANSHGAIGPVQIGTSVTAYINRSMTTLEQTHYEYVKIPDKPLDKRTYLLRDETGYTVKKTVSQGEEIIKVETRFSLDHLQGFISEGSNLLLQRIMVKRGVPPGLTFLAFDSDKNLSTSTYTSLGEKTQAIGPGDVTLVGIDRTIHSTNEPSTSWEAYFLQDGHLASRKQVGSGVSMKLINLPLPPPREETQEKVVSSEEKLKPLRWDEDMQLYSRFLDRKAGLSDDHATYMRRHPELRALLADFLQFLLLRKPDNVCEFASDFFSAFSSATPSGPSFAQSGKHSTQPSAVP